MGLKSATLNALRFKFFLNLTSSSNFYWLPCVLPQLFFEMVELTLLSPQTEFCSCPGLSHDSFQLGRGVFASGFVSSLGFQKGIPGPPWALKVEALLGQKEFCRDVAPAVGHCDMLSSLPEARGDILSQDKPCVSWIPQNIKYGWCQSRNWSYFLLCFKCQDNVWSVSSVESHHLHFLTNLIPGLVLLYNLDFPHFVSFC